MKIMKKKKSNKRKLFVSVPGKHKSIWLVKNQMGVELEAGEDTEEEEKKKQKGWRRVVEVV